MSVFIFVFVIVFVIVIVIVITDHNAMIEFSEMGQQFGCERR